MLKYLRMVLGAEELEKLIDRYVAVKDAAIAAMPKGRRKKKIRK